MATKKKTYKKLTNKEKAFNREVKKHLVEVGALPPPKKKLNRKKFAEETRKEFEENIKTYSDINHVYEAIGIMTSKGYGQITAEQVGALKILKLAVEIKRYKEALLEQGVNQYTVGDYYHKVIEPIVKL